MPLFFYWPAGRHAGLRVNGLRVQVEHGDRVVETHEGDPLGFIAEAFQARFSPRRRTTACRALRRRPGGLFWLRNHQADREKLAARPANPDPIGTPDILLMQSEELAVVDNLSGQLI